MNGSDVIVKGSRVGMFRSETMKKSGGTRPDIDEQGCSCVQRSTGGLLGFPKLISRIKSKNN